MDHRWINDIAGHLTATGIAQCLLLLSTVARIFRDVSQPDVFSWPWETGGTYTARSTYMALSQGSTVMAGAKCIWGSWAPLKCKIFAWLALQHRLWTADRRTRHGNFALLPMLTGGGYGGAYSDSVCLCTGGLVGGPPEAWFGCSTARGRGSPRRLVVGSQTSTWETWQEGV